MDPRILAFSQIMAILVPSVAALTGVGVLAHWIVERTNRLSRTLPRQTVDNDRLQRLEQAVDTIAVEVERLGEGQRFVTKLLMERSSEVHPTNAAAQRGRVITPH